MRPAAAGHMGFIGVTTAASSINRVFPAWARILDLPTDRLVGHDLPLDATDAAVRALVSAIRDDPSELGALVTTHKVRVFTVAGDLFDELDPFAQACGEVSSISKRDGRLIGHAKDPITAGLALGDAIPPDHFARTGGAVLILGAGGSGTALAWHLAGRADGPSRVLVTGRTADRLDALRRVLARRPATSDVVVRPVLAPGPADAAVLLASMPPGSLVANATGMGKDRPGSPLPDGVAFPREGVAWEFNYRGSLEFLHQAEARRAADGLTVVDGWRYFIHGWSQVIAEVFDRPLTPPLVERLAEAAAGVR